MNTVIQIIFILLVFIMQKQNAFAACLIQPRQIEKVAQKLHWQDSRGKELNTLTLQSSVSGTITSRNTDLEVLNNETFENSPEAELVDSKQNETNDVTMTYEAFIRPERDGIFQLLPLPMFYLQMEKERDSVYICAEINADQSKTKAVIFFLKYGRILPIIPKPLPLNPIKKFFWKIFHKTPLVIVDLPFYLADKIQEKTFNLIGILTKVGVDRIRIDGNYVELYTGGDPTQFNNYLYRKTIKMKEDE